MQAIAITAYTDYLVLRRLVARLVDDFFVLVHIDKSSQEYSDDEILELQRMGAYVYSRYKTFWGSYSHFQAICDMANKALNANDVTHIHVISGQDYPLRTASSIRDFFENDSRIYMRVLGEEDFNSDMRNNAYYYDYFQWADTKKNGGKCLLYASWLMQKMIGTRRRRWGEFQNVFQGLIWMSAPVEIWCYLLTYLDAHPEFVRDMKRVRLPEEYAFQTILMNSPYRERVTGDNLRFDIWDNRGGSLPAVLDMRDWEAIKNSGALFARKLQTGKSEALIDAIDKQCSANRVN